VVAADSPSAGGAFVTRPLPDGSGDCRRVRDCRVVLTLPFYVVWRQ
jgi:hypothetical protein